MNYLKRKKTAVEAWFDRCASVANHRRAPLLASVCIPLLFGLLSLMLGQDNGIDLRNYHLYNPYAFLNGRVGFDMAPAQFQAYFNPLLDILYYEMTLHLAAPLAGFIMGALHGLNVVLLIAIARRLLPALADKDRYRVPVLLSVAACFGAGFLSELGNAMGDNLTALLVSAALYIVLAYWDRLPARSWRAAAVLLGAGSVIGLALGLKPTNVVYALGLCLAFLFLARGFWLRIRLSFLFGIGVLAGMALTGGFWFWKMWQLFGNPVFPQFNTFFHSPLARQVAIIDTSFIPKNLFEYFFWPLIFTLDFHRVSELVLRQIVWPVAFMLFLVFAMQWLVARLAGTFGRPGTADRPGRPAIDEKTRFFLAFFCLSYFAWLGLFGIYRYLIALELLAPLLIWILFHRVAGAAVARRLAAYVLTLAFIVVFPFPTWGHSAWSSKAFSAEVPAFAEPRQSTVFTVHGDPPLAWMVHFFPQELRFISLGSGFPESPAYLKRIDAMVAGRAGPNYVMVYARTNHEEVNVKKENALIEWLGIDESEAGCARLDAVLQRLRVHVGVRRLDGKAGRARCELEVLPKYRVDLAQKDRLTLALAEQKLRFYGFRIVAGTCRKYAAFIGKEPYPYQLCEVVGRGALPPAAANDGI